MDIKKVVIYKLALVLVGVSTLNGCFVFDDDDDNSSPPVLQSSGNITIDDLTCINGGLLLKEGKDSNGNGVLDTDEVQSTSEVCNESDVEAPDPLIAALESSSQNISVGESVTLQVTPAESGFSSEYMYEWMNVNTGEVLAEVTPAIEIVTGALGTEVFRVTVFAPDGTQQTREISFTVEDVLRAREVQVAATSSKQVFLPDGFLANEAQPSGDFDGFVVNAGPNLSSAKERLSLAKNTTLERNDVSAFIAQRPALGMGQTALDILNSFVNDLGILPGLTLSNVGTSLTGEGAIVAVGTYDISSDSLLTSTELNNTIIERVGINQLGGVVSNLPVSGSADVAVNLFQLNLSVAYFSEDLILIMAAVVSKEQVGLYQSQVTGLTNGTNIGDVGDTLETDVDEFVQQEANSLADFLFVIDNSGSMGDEQVAVSQAAADFSTVIQTAGLDFMVGTITTDADVLRGGAYTNDLSQFQANVRAGTSGSATETGIFYSERSLKSVVLGDEINGSSTNAGHPRVGASQSVVIISDEPSQYPRRSFTEFNPQENLFVERNYRVYSIVNEAQASFSQYDDIAFATGGQVASINDLASFPSIMSQIAFDAGGLASAFRLEFVPVSSTIRVLVNGVEVPNSASNGWQYNANSNSVFFTGSSIPSEGDSVEVVYNHISSGL